MIVEVSASRKVGGPSILGARLLFAIDEVAQTYMVVDAFQLVTGQQGH